MNILDGQNFKKIVTSGANNLYNHYPEVDALNVFPVPDGDTGINMNLTMTNGSKEISTSDSNDIYQISKSFSKALLMGARGNSGAITSQIFRGLSIGFEGKKSVNAKELSQAFLNASKVAYGAVITPVEGTILTVIRESSTKLSEKVNKKTTIEGALRILYEEALESLERTPDLLPVLKEVGVVDSGGAGLCRILEGMYLASINKFVERKINDKEEKAANVAQTQFEEDEFGYCTEFIMRLGPEEEKKPFNKNRFTSVLSSKGNSLVVVQDEDIVKIHIHTLKPGDIFNYAQQFGEFVKLKCENMTEQHHEILFNEGKENSIHMAASDLVKAPLAAPKINKNKKRNKYSLIATSSGEGITKLFKEVGVTQIVSGGQTMNPSTNDFLNAIKDANAEIVYILPNNGNIILAANQARDILKGKVNVIVIPTKTIMQGVIVAMNFNSDGTEEENTLNMNDAINSIKSGQITFAIKDSEVNGIKIKKGEFLSIRESKDIIGSYKDKITALMKLLESEIDEDSSVCTILCGEDITLKEMDKIKKSFEAKYEFIDIDIRSGGQPVYSFIIGIE